MRIALFAAAIVLGSCSAERQTSPVPDPAAAATVVNDDIRISAAYPHGDRLCGGKPCFENAATHRRPTLGKRELAVSPINDEGAIIEKDIDVSTAAHQLSAGTRRTQRIGALTCTGEAKLFGPGLLAGCALAEDATIEGIAVTGAVELYRSGKLKVGQLAAPQRVNGIELPAGSRVTLSEGGLLERAELASDTVIAGVPRKARETICFDLQGTAGPCRSE